MTLLHRAVSLEKRNTVGHALDTGHEVEIIVELDGSGTHVMADAGLPNARAEVVAGLAPVGAGELTPQEGCHQVRLEAVHGGLDDGIGQK